MPPVSNVVIATVSGFENVACVTTALANPKAIGLPAEAGGNPEGYLFPATYTVPPKQDATGLIRQMVAKSVEVDESLDLADRAEQVNLTP